MLILSVTLTKNVIVDMLIIAAMICAKKTL